MKYCRNVEKGLAPALNFVYYYLSAWLSVRKSAAIEKQEENFQAQGVGMEEEWVFY